MADAVVVPGGGYGPDAGMLLYAGLVAQRRGATVHRHTWSGYFPDPFQPPIEPWVRADITPVLDRLGGRPLLIGKSLGTYASEVAAERELPAVWLTPILTVPWAFRRVTAPALLIGGTADRYWDGAAAAALTPHVLEVEGADHGLTVPGPVGGGTVAVLGRVLTAIDGFLDAIGWP